MLTLYYLNHFHFLLRIKDEETLLSEKIEDYRKLSFRFGTCFNAYAKAYNKKYNRVSSLFENRFGRSEIKSDAHFTSIISYIHFNPQRHRYINDFREWRYSSYQTFLSDKETLLPRAEIIDWFGGVNAFLEAHDQDFGEWKYYEDGD